MLEKGKVLTFAIIQLGCTIVNCSKSHQVSYFGIDHVPAPLWLHSDLDLALQVWYAFHGLHHVLGYHVCRWTECTGQTHQHMHITIFRDLDIVYQSKVVYVHTYLRIIALLKFLNYPGHVLLLCGWMFCDLTQIRLQLWINCGLIIGQPSWRCLNHVLSL